MWKEGEDLMRTWRKFFKHSDPSLSFKWLSVGPGVASPIAPTSIEERSGWVPFWKECCFLLWNWILAACVCVCVLYPITPETQSRLEWGREMCAVWLVSLPTPSLQKLRPHLGKLRTLETWDREGGQGAARTWVSEAWFLHQGMGEVTGGGLDSTLLPEIESFEIHCFLVSRRHLRAARWAGDALHLWEVSFA